MSGTTSAQFNTPDTTLLTSSFVSLPVIDTTNHLLVILDPLGVNGAPEIVKVTNHAASGNALTVVRGFDGTAARVHPLGTTWFHGPAVSDYVPLLATSGARPNPPYTGQQILETDTTRLMKYTGAAWQQYGLYFDPPACRLRASVPQSIPNSTQTVAVFDIETYDTDTMHDNVTNNTRITFRTAGLYIVAGGGEFATAADYQMHGAYIRLNGSTPIFLGDGGAQTTNNPGAWFNVSGVYKFAVNDYVEMVVQQVNGAAAARNMTAVADYSPVLTATWIGRGN